MFNAIFLLSDYYENTYYTEYECNFPMLDHAELTATTSLRERGAKNARLNGKFRACFCPAIYYNPFLAAMIRIR